MSTTSTRAKSFYWIKDATRSTINTKKDPHHNFIEVSLKNKLKIIISIFARTSVTHNGMKPVVGFALM